MEIIKFLIENHVLFSIDWYGNDGSFQVTIGGDYGQEQFIIKSDKVSRVVKKEDFLNALKHAVKDEFTRSISDYLAWPPLALKSVSL